MTTDEALEYCKRFDDPKLREQMGTDFSNATGTVGALLALRAEIEALLGKVRELEATLMERRAAMTDAFANFKSSYDEGRHDALVDTLGAMVELGLITEASDE